MALPVTLEYITTRSVRRQRTIQKLPQRRVYTEQQNNWLSTDKEYFSEGCFLVQWAFHSFLHLERGMSAQRQDRQLPLYSASDELYRIGIFISKDYPFFPYDLKPLGVAYCKLGDYVVTHMWDKAHDSIIYRKVMFKFVYTPDQTRMWWEIDHQIYYIPRVSEPGFVCPICNNYSPLLYDEGPLCLRQGCDAFWVVEPSVELHISNEFLLAVLGQDHDTECVCLDICRQSKKPPAFHCTVCGWLTPRYIWNSLICDLCGAYEWLKIEWATSTFNKPTYNYDEGAVILAISTKDSRWSSRVHERVSFQIRGESAHIHLLKASGIALEEAHEIHDSYLHESGNGTICFKRTPLRRHKSNGVMFTNYFSHNTGHPYEYVGGNANTTSWEDVGQSPKSAKKHITNTLKTVFTNVPDFNELLRRGLDWIVIHTSDINDSVWLTYLINQWCDDEKGVQAFIASLSLGSDAIMQFRAKGDPKASPILLSIRLTHGDIVVMEGDAIQKNYLYTPPPVKCEEHLVLTSSCFRHRVQPFGHRIAATA
ncbi:hypothetical protein EV421DRAFT_1912719 [Armillaria borealis]|uniref:Alpha-ketoglutarate-dependent dioxygenase AlkB-like domain-containing protein n=1 Tax=Armillaria borealis TaxID=47425 RepID=A0AA39IWR8_9AGAR|nr:hypothetical protein EV421DRAFT_1912719 [Armillaria borealis]